MSLLGFLTLGVMSTYLFMGRNLERLMSTQQQGTKARRLTRQFTQDARSAMEFSPSSTSTLVEFTVPTQRSLSNCTTTLGGTTVTCASTTGLTAGQRLAADGLAYGTTVASVVNSTTFVISSAATASRGGVTVYVVIPVRYTYSAANATLQRMYNGANDPVQPLLTNIDASVTTPANGFGYFSQEGVAVSPGSPFLKQVEFVFTTASGNLSIGTKTSYTIVSPRVILRNKPIIR